VFGRNATSDPNFSKPLGSSGPDTSGPRPVVSTSSPFGAATTMGSSVIGTDLAIIGEKITIISQNKLQIDGDIRGDVNGRQVVIGEDGSVIGTVSAETIEVRGGVRGAIRGHSVTLLPTAQVEGDITHQTLAIAEGAQFDGRVRRAKDPSEVKPQLDPAAVAASLPQSSQISG
jgi:cytoskeletal protein CcmA (bactofilin family)